MAPKSQKVGTLELTLPKRGSYQSAQGVQLWADLTAADQKAGFYLFLVRPGERDKRPFRFVLGASLGDERFHIWLTPETGGSFSFGPAQVLSSKVAQLSAFLTAESHFLDFRPPDSKSPKLLLQANLWEELAVTVDRATRTGVLLLPKRTVRISELHEVDLLADVAALLPAGMSLEEQTRRHHLEKGDLELLRGVRTRLFGEPVSWFTYDAKLQANGEYQVVSRDNGRVPPIDRPDEVPLMSSTPFGVSGGNGAYFDASFDKQEEETRGAPPGGSPATTEAGAFSMKGNLYQLSDAGQVSGVPDGLDAAAVVRPKSPYVALARAGIEQLKRDLGSKRGDPDGLNVKVYELSGALEARQNDDFVRAMAKVPADICPAGLNTAEARKAIRAWTFCGLGDNERRSFLDAIASAAGQYQTFVQSLSLIQEGSGRGPPVDFARDAPEPPGHPASDVPDQRWIRVATCAFDFATGHARFDLHMTSIEQRLDAFLEELGGTKVARLHASCAPGQMTGGGPVGYTIHSYTSRAAGVDNSALAKARADNTGNALQAAWGRFKSGGMGDLVPIGREEFWKGESPGDDAIRVFPQTYYGDEDPTSSDPVRAPKVLALASDLPGNEWKSRVSVVRLFARAPMPVAPDPAKPRPINSLKVMEKLKVRSGMPIQLAVALDLSMYPNQDFFTVCLVVPGKKIAAAR